MQVLIWTGNLGSTTLLAMALNGDIPPFDQVVLPDPGWERPELISLVRAYLPLMAKCAIPFTHLKTRALPNLLAPDPTAILPFWQNADYPRRAVCAELLKERAVFDFLTDLLARPIYADEAGECEIVFGVMPPAHAERTPPSPRKRFVYTYPLVELDLSAELCALYLKQSGSPVLTGSQHCLCCPFQSSSDWREIAERYHSDWARLTYFDSALRSLHSPNRRRPARYFTPHLLPLAKLIRAPELPAKLEPNQPPSPYCWS
jgi:hypothetical protein